MIESSVLSLFSRIEYGNNILFVLVVVDVIVVFIIVNSKIRMFWRVVVKYRDLLILKLFDICKVILCIIMINI